MFLNHCKKQQHQKYIFAVRVGVEFTTLALSAPRSADWANRPTAAMHLQDRILKATIYTLVKNEGVVNRKTSFFHNTRVIKHSKVVIIALLGCWR